MKLFICVLALAASVISEESNDALLKASNEVFTSNLFKQVVNSNPGKNVVLSAFSVLSPLAQLSLASVGESHDEILKAIGLPNDNVTKEVFSGMTKHLRAVKGVQLSIANRVYVREGAVLNDQFAATSREVFNSDVKNVDFAKSVEAAKEINTWVEDNTNHKIQNLVSEDSLSSSTAAVLINAIYFKGKWLTPFDAADTNIQNFFVSKDKPVQKEFMKRTGDYKYAESKELDAKLLEMPYEGEQSSLIIVLPNEIDGITNLLKKLEDPSALSKATENMFTNAVLVSLPKFKIETTTDLKDVLQKMNIEKLFTPGLAKLNNLVKGQSDLYISKAVQKAFIEVNEDGAEAAAASLYGGPTGAIWNILPDPRKQFRVDRPFYFALFINKRITFNGIVKT